MRRSTLAFLACFSLIAAGALVPGVTAQDHADKKRHREFDDGGFSARDEFRQSYRLAPDSIVEINGINGKAEVETTMGDVAEVHIVRLARNREDLDYKKIIVEHTGNRLVVRGEKEDRETRRLHRDRHVRHEIMLTIPRNVEFIASGINGRVRVGELDGPAKLSGINGRVEVARAAGYSEISGVNGSVTVTIARLGERGINLSGINGGVELRFTDDVNADLHVSGNNGSVHADLPDVTVQGKMERHNFRARIGAGGTPISVSGVNGRVRLIRAGGGI